MHFWSTWRCLNCWLYEQACLPKASSDRGWSFWSDEQVAENWRYFRDKQIESHHGSLFSAILDGVGSKYCFSSQWKFTERLFAQCVPQYDRQILFAVFLYLHLWLEILRLLERYLRTRTLRTKYDNALLNRFYRSNNKLESIASTRQVNEKSFFFIKRWRM